MIHYFRCSKLNLWEHPKSPRLTPYKPRVSEGHFWVHWNKGKNKGLSLGMQNEEQNNIKKKCDYVIAIAQRKA